MLMTSEMSLRQSTVSHSLEDNNPVTPKLTNDPQPNYDHKETVGSGIDRWSSSPQHSSECDEDYAMSFAHSYDFPSDIESLTSNIESNDSKTTSSSEEDQYMDCSAPIMQSHSQPEPFHPLPFPNVSLEGFMELIKC